MWLVEPKQVFGGRHIFDTEESTLEMIIWNSCSAGSVYIYKNTCILA